MILDLRLGCIEKKHIPQIGGEKMVIYHRNRTKITLNKQRWCKSAFQRHLIETNLPSRPFNPITPSLSIPKKQFPSISQKITGNKRKQKISYHSSMPTGKKHHITLGAKTCCIKVVLFATNVPWLKHRISSVKRGIQKCGYNPPNWGIFSQISSTSRQNLYHSFKILTCVVDPQKLKMTPGRRGGG